MRANQPSNPTLRAGKSPARCRHRKGFWNRTILAGSLLGIWVHLGGNNGVMDVPASQQIPILLKAFTYDRGLKERLSPEMRIGVLYSSTDASSLAARDEVVSAFERLGKANFKGLPVTHSAIETPGDWVGRAHDKGINVLYITPGVDLEVLESVQEFSDQNKVVTMTGVLAYAEEGIACWGIYEQLGKPKLILNLKSCKSAGCKLDSRLLRRARVLR